MSVLPLNNCYGKIDESPLNPFQESLLFNVNLSNGKSQQLTLFGSSRYLLDWDKDDNMYTDAMLSFSKFFTSTLSINENSQFRVLRFHSSPNTDSFHFVSSVVPSQVVIKGLKKRQKKFDKTNVVTHNETARRNLKR